jgi:transposase
MQEVVEADKYTSPTSCLFVAFELSLRAWILAVKLPTSDKISQYHVEGGDTGAVLALIQRARSKASEALGGEPVAVISCYEAGRDGFWLHRLLGEHDVRNLVIDAASIHVSRRARRAKTDRLDADSLVRVLMAYCRGERKACSVLRIPSVTEEDAKRQTRERGRLVTARTGHVNRIKGLLIMQGIRHLDPLRPDFPARLASARTGDGQTLGPGLLAELLREWERLQMVISMIRAIERERDAPRTEETALRSPAAKIERLQQLRGIGPAFATVLTREVFYRSFDNRRQLGSYVGLAPTPFNSGSMRRDQGISKSGNPRARSTAVELAWLWLRHQPESDLSQWFHARVGQLAGGVRKVAVIAVARKLIIALWRYLETGLVPTGATFKT